MAGMLCLVETIFEDLKMFNHSEYFLKKILFMLTALSLFFGVIDTRRSDHHTIGMVIAAEIDALHQRKKDIHREI